MVLPYPTGAGLGFSIFGLTSFPFSYLIENQDPNYRFPPIGPHQSCPLVFVYVGLFCKTLQMFVQFYYV